MAEKGYADLANILLLNSMLTVKTSYSGLMRMLLHARAVNIVAPIYLSRELSLKRALNTRPDRDGYDTYIGIRRDLPSEPVVRP